MLSFLASLLMLALSASASPISDKYAALGGASGFLGSPTIPESTTPDGIGRYRHYQHGSIYWSPLTSAHEVHGLIRERWSALGWEQSYLGYPMTDEIDTFDAAGRVSKFQGGELIWRKATNAVSEVKSSDLVLDLPFPVGEPFFVIQANAVAPTDSHGGPWAYCFDFMRAGHPQPFSDGKPFAAAATSELVYVEEGLNSGESSNNPGNIIIQRMGEGRYASYLHDKKGTYSENFGKAPGGGLNFLPQALPWSDRPKPKSGVTLADMGDTGANVGAYHLHFCVCTSPDRPQFKPFESVPVSFQNYSVSTDSGSSWTHVNEGVPRLNQWIRRDPAKPAQSSPKAKSSATIDFGTVKGEVKLAGPGKPAGPGKLTVSVVSAWGEPLRTATINVGAGNLNGPWPFSIADAPAYPGLSLGASFHGPWSEGLGGGTVGGESGKFDLAPNGTATANVELKAMVLK
jgi:hypothetical protein